MVRAVAEALLPHSGLCSVHLFTVSLLAAVLTLLEREDKVEAAVCLIAWPERSEFNSRCYRNIHRPGRLNNVLFFFFPPIDLKAGKAKIMMLANLVFGEGPLPGCILMWEKQEALLCHHFLTKAPSSRGFHCHGLT